MDLNKNILVFPCGSEIGLEIYNSLEHSVHFNLIGASSVDDHGKFVFKNYIGGLPLVNDETFIDCIEQIVVDYNIDAIYPTMDSVIYILKNNERKLNCKIISSDLETTAICLSKFKTYVKLKDIVPSCYVYTDYKLITQFPVFIKPDVGYGSRGVKKAENIAEVIAHLNKYPDSLVLEYLPGKEYTIDCFSNFKHELLFIGQRERKRISNGISVNTSTMPLSAEFESMAVKINEAIKFSGAWFFQVKERENGTIALMEIASRMAGSSGVYRIKGVNFAALSIYDSFEIDVSILLNKYEVEVDRALSSKYKIDIDFDHVYMDFDDTLINKNRINVQAISAIYQFINAGKKIYLITKHNQNIYASLNKFRIDNLFDEIIHIKKDDFKWKHIAHKNSIFIDDSFMERKQAKANLNIPVFDVNAIEGLLI